MLREQIIRSNEERDGDGLESSKMDNINKINMNKDSLLYSCPAPSTTALFNNARIESPDSVLI